MMSKRNLTLAITLTLVSLALTQAQTRSSRPTTVSVRPDGLAIKLNRQDLRSGRTYQGSRDVAQRTITAIQDSRRACYNIDRNKLGTQVRLHALANLVPLKSVQRHANPVNVTWPELRRRR